MSVNQTGSLEKEERMQEVVFDSLSFPFISKPVLFGGKAMEFYGLRKGHDFDWVVSPEDFSWLRQCFPEWGFINLFGDEGVRVGDHEFYLTHFGYGYAQWKHGAIERQDHHVIHLELLLFLKTMTLVYEPDNRKARSDIPLLMHKLGVWPLISAPEQVMEVPPDLLVQEGL
jgi:hypothetical protein